MSETEQIQAWLKDNAIEDVEAFVPDMAGAARGKVLPAGKFGTGELKLPEGIFAQTISGDYATNKDNVEDRDMLLRPDLSTLRPVPWASDPPLQYSWTVPTVMASPSIPRHVMCCAKFSTSSKRKAGDRLSRPRSSST